MNQNSIQFLKRIMGKTDFSVQFRKKRVGFNLNVMLKFACLVYNQITARAHAPYRLLDHGQ